MTNIYDVKIYAKYSGVGQIIAMKRSDNISSSIEIIYGERKKVKYDKVS